MYQLKYKVWLDKEGKVFGKGPYELLLGIKKYGSLNEAAKHMKMSYNKAHTLIKDIEKKLGFTLIETKSGGNGGGGSKLTKKADELMVNYELFINECEENLKAIFEKYFN